MAEKKPAREAVAGHCIAEGCRGNEWRFTFCQEHFDQFKFGLIKKDGHNVSDYDKKFEHYTAHKKRQTAHKVA